MSFDIEKEKRSRKASASPDHIMLSISGDARTSMTVTWRTDLSVDNGYLEYRDSITDEVFVQEAVVEQFESDESTTNIYWATPKNLKAGRKYYYTCGDKEHRSEEFSFETEEENLTKFSFIAISDHQKGGGEVPDYSVLQNFLKNVLSEHPEVKFILTAGDNTDCGQHEVQWNGMFKGMKGIIESVPFMMTCGNHDNRGFAQYLPVAIGRYYAEPAEFFNNQFKHSYPYNGPGIWKTENYSFDYGNVHFNVMGVNGPEEVNDWLIEDIGKSDKTWKLGTYHFPIYYAGPELQNDDAYPVMREGMEKLDILFSGHEHSFARSFPIRNEEIFDKPSQGTIHYMLGNAHQNGLGSKTVAKVWHTAFYTQEEPNCMFTLVEVDGNKMTLTSYIDDGRIADRCVIDKDKDEIQPYSVAPIYLRPRLMFKGVDLGLCAAANPPVEKDGIWFVPFATLIGFIGGYVNKTEGAVTLDAYGHTAVFKENSKEVKTNKGVYEMSAEVFRGERGQLYMPADDCAEIFGMKWCYVKRNNFLSFEHESEDKPIFVQP